MQDVKTIQTPTNTSTKVDKDEKGKSVDMKVYRDMFGSLFYPITSRSDKMFSLCLCWLLIVLVYLSYWFLLIFHNICLTCIHPLLTMPKGEKNWVDVIQCDTLWYTCIFLWYLIYFCDTWEELVRYYMHFLSAIW